MKIYIVTCQSTINCVTTDPDEAQHVARMLSRVSYQVALSVFNDGTVRAERTITLPADWEGDIL